MIKKNKMKLLIYVNLSITAALIPLNKCGAELNNLTVTPAIVKIHGGNNTLNTLGIHVGDDGGYYQTQGTKKFRASISTTFNADTTFEVSAYDKEGNHIINSDMTIDSSKAILAGTWVGLNITEEHRVSYNVKVDAEEIKKVVICNYEKYHAGYWDNSSTSGVTSCPGGTFTLFPGSSMMGTCTKPYWVPGWTEYHHTEAGPMDYYEEYSCPTNIGGGWTFTGDETKDDPGHPAGDYAKKLETKLLAILSAAAQASVSTPTAKIKYFTSNDYDEPTHEILTAVKVGTMSGSDEAKAYSQKFEYYPSNVCMNVLTSDVTYNDNNCNTTENKTIIEHKVSKEGKKYWHYFVPLNITSDKVFSLDILSNDEKIFFFEQCKNFIDEHPTDYTKYLSPQSSTINFTGNIIEDLTRLAGEKIKEIDGCKFSANIIIPVKQRFYNETDENKLVGFNFYYKPIEITNPFPNGLNDTSLWYDWNKSSKKNPDITKSYNEVTYVAQISSVKEIRDYTKENPYTTWKNMNTSGLSDFIEKEGIIKRLIDKNKIYKLGCGPLNENQYNKDGSINYLYRKWCDKS